MLDNLKNDQVEVKIRKALEKEDKFLDLRFSGLREVPLSVFTIQSLKRLYLGGNQLIRLPPEIGQLTNLEILDVSANRLTALPAEMSALKRLTKLDAGLNDLASLPSPSDIPSSLVALDLYENPKLGIPDSILRAANRPADIVTYFHAIREGGTPLNEVKVMLVGRGGAGKTSLRNRLARDYFDQRERETPGIALESMQLMVGANSVKIHIWDFAGQEITHALHQFFFTERSVYIIVLEARADTQDQDVEYWMRLITMYGKDSPVIIVLNKQGQKQFDVDRFALREKFPSIISFVPTDCMENDGIDKLKHDLVSTISSMESIRTLITNSWTEIKTACWRHENNYLSLSGFRQLCSLHGEVDERKQDSLARILHHLGAVLHYIDDPRLRDTSVLNPHWVTNGVYTLLRYRDIPHGDGIMTFQNALGALPTESEEAVRFLLRLMEKFEMCFPIPNPDASMVDECPESWLIPGALSRFQPQLGEEWKSPEGIKIRYTYDILPEGLLPQLIVRTFPLGEGSPRWRSGVVIRLEGAQALIRTNSGNRSVDVVIQGREEARRRIAQLLRGHFARIHRELRGEEPKEELLVFQAKQLFAPVATMIADENLRQDTVLNTPAGGVKVPRDEALDSISHRQFRGSRATSPKLFLSYAHKDSVLVKQFKQNLTILENQKLLSLWYDGNIEPSVEWRTEIEKQLNEMDVFVGVVSTAYLASNFIQTVEVKAALERRAAEGIPVVMVILESCSWQTFEFSRFQVVLPNGRPVRQTRPVSEAFYVVEDKIRDVLRHIQQHAPDETIRSIGARQHIG